MALIAGAAYGRCTLIFYICVPQELEEPDEEDTHRFDSLIPTIVRPPPSSLPQPPPVCKLPAPFPISLVPFSLPSGVDTSSSAPALSASPHSWVSICDSTVEGDGNLGQGSISNKVIFLITF
ncbi:hypothetical protein E2C01_075865 [Portunus trituberculatus]|uniref:Uncharacterized protein n=1 Tax=Portunus trituberculatus TaxID=210409 RepID=A0A5B7IKH3_PORTR|nr:hypothetical protein [Portunus trituberculatus]